MINRIVLLALLLAPFQNFAVPLAGSRYDISAFLLLGVAVICTLRARNLNAVTVLCLSCFLLSQITIFALLRVAPSYRLISGLVWMGGWLLLGRIGVRAPYNRRRAYKAVLVVLFLASVRIFYQYVFLDAERPAAWFDEPSYAGLLLYSASAALVVVVLSIRLQRSQRLTLLAMLGVLLAAAAMTLSMHMVTFVITVLLATPVRATRRSLRVSPRRAVGVLMFVSLLLIAAPLVLRVNHYMDRLNLGGGNTNFSVLSWLRGFDQMTASVAMSPLFGMGLGSTGYFNFESEHSVVLESLDRGNLNLTDAYSLAFRLIIEMGLPLFVLGCLYCVRKLIAFRAYLVSSPFIPPSESVPQAFLFVFGLSLVIGSLIKEPSYARSGIYLGVFFLSSVGLRRAALAVMHRKVPKSGVPKVSVAGAENIGHSRVRTAFVREAEPWPVFV